MHHGHSSACSTFDFSGDPSDLCGVVSDLVSNQCVQGQLNAAYKGKILLLRNFYAGSDLEYDQNGTVLKGSISGPWTLADVEIKGVTVTSQGIEIVGNRLGTLYNKEKPGYIKVGELRIHVAKLVSDVDSDATLNAIFSRIFIELGEDLRPMLPDCWAYY